MAECIFCKIAKKEVLADIVFEDEKIVVFKDINPKADVHLLIIPRKHIQSANEIGESDKDLVSHMILSAKEIAAKNNVAQSGYRLQINVGRGGGQLVDHLHLHLIANKG